MTRRELSFSYTHSDLIERLDLPKTSVILSMFTQTYCGGPRTFNFKVSIEEKEIDKLFGKKTKEKKK